MHDPARRPQESRPQPATRAERSAPESPRDGQGDAHAAPLRARRTAGRAREGNRRREGRNPSARCASENLSPRQGLPARGRGGRCQPPRGAGWVQLGGAQGGGSRGKFYRPFDHQHLPSQGGETELCTSMSPAAGGGRRRGGRQAAQRAGAATRLPSLLGYDGGERVSWGSPERT